MNEQVQHDQAESGKSAQWHGSEVAMRAFIARFDTPEFRDQVVRDSDEPAAEINTRLDTYFAEMIYGYRFAAEHMPDRKLRIMEVGAGLGLVSAYLTSLGHDVVALEPANAAFGIFEATKGAIWERLGDDAPVLVECSAENINPKETGDFDFIFSVNVMEHIDDLDTATASILKVLRPGGTCANSCPNYWVPYEPHYGIPMVPGGFHSLTRRLFAKSIDANPFTWDTLNFVNVGWVKRMAQHSNVDVKLEKELLYKTFKRLGNDEEFIKRHKSTIVGSAYRFLKSTRLLEMTRHLPISMSTPMVFIYSKPLE